MPTDFFILLIEDLFHIAMLVWVFNHGHKTQFNFLAFEHFGIYFFKSLLNQLHVLLLIFFDDGLADGSQFEIFLDAVEQNDSSPAIEQGADINHDIFNKGRIAGLNRILLVIPGGFLFELEEVVPVDNVVAVQGVDVEVEVEKFVTAEAVGRLDQFVVVQQQLGELVH